MSDFIEFPKIARLSRECVITEKIDGTNAQVLIVRRCSCVPPAACSDCPNPRLLIAEKDGLVMYAGSRTQFITPERDNHGFARWVQQHAEELFALGEGQHFGEWWGSGVQRGYGLQKGEKRFSLFNVARWADVRDSEKYPQNRPTCCDVVPVLYRGLFTTNAAHATLSDLQKRGSFAAPGFMKPEGIVIWHEAARLMFKKTLEKDEEPKGRASQAVASASAASVV